MAPKGSAIAAAIKEQQAKEQAAPDDAATHVAIAAAIQRGEDPATATPKAPVIDYVCGLRRVGPSKYVVVSGLVKDGKPDLRAEAIAQGLDHAAEELRAEFQRLVEFIP